MLTVRYKVSVSKSRVTGSVVDGGHLHIGAELAVFYMEAPRFALCQELLVQRDGQIGLGGMGKAGPGGILGRRRG